MFIINSNKSKQSESESKSDDTKNILLVGNGFDLAVGLNTSYSDFVKYIAIKIYLSKTSGELKSNTKYRDWVKKCLTDDKNELDLKDCSFTKIIIEQLNDVDKYFTFYRKENDVLGAVTLRKNYFLNDFLQVVLGKYLYCVLFNCQLDSINNLETNPIKSCGILLYSDYFSEIEKSFNNSYKQSYNSRLPSEREIFEANHNLFGFIKVLNSNIEKSKIKQWLDVESYIEFLVTNDRDLCVRFYPNDKEHNSTLFLNPSLYNDYFNGIDEFSVLFEEYLKTILPNSFVFFDSINSCVYSDFINFRGSFVASYTNSLKNRSHGYLDFGNFSNVSEIINYNYTYTSEAYFNLNFVKDIQNKTYHVNGVVDYNTLYNLSLNKNNSNHLVFGFSKANSIKLKSTLHTFEKKVLRVIKNTSPLNLDKLTSKPFNLLIYGHSCGVADGDVIGKLLKSKNLKIAVVLCLDQDSLVSITNNLIEILEQDKFDELLNNANQKLGEKSLYFAVRDEFS